jgi:hypothetical protein
VKSILFYEEDTPPSREIELPRGKREVKEKVEKNCEEVMDRQEITRNRGIS